MSNLTEFLKARLDEDARDAEEVHESHCATAGPISFPCDCGYPARVLSEVAAKRVILAQHPVRPARNGTCQVCADVEGTSYLSYLGDEHEKAPPPCPTLRALAAVYSDHPDYRPEWAS